MSLRRRAATVAAVAALASGPAVLLASPAAAAPLGCTTQYSAGQWASSQCSAGTGKHQVIVLQRHPSPLAGPILVVGPCVPVGQVSHTSITPWPIVSIRAGTCG